MEKQTLYEILEVSENASPEIIEKAYKVLVKKYHPDLQEVSEKQKAEEKMKRINEAYYLLGNEEKRKKYDEELKQKREAEKERYYQEQKLQNSQVNENYYAQNYNSDVKNESKKDYDFEKEKIKYQERLRKEEAKQRKRMQENLNKEYENAYSNYLRSLGYKVKHRWTKENLIDLLMVLAIMAIIITALWFIPLSHDWMVNFYEENPILKTIIDIIIGIVTGIFTGIWSFVTGLFS